MQINPGIVCNWFVSAGFLLEALRRIDAWGSSVICVVDDKTGTVKNGFVIYYKNPPAPQSEGGGEKR